MVNNILRDTFLLSLLLIVVVYWSGSVHLVQALGDKGNSLLLTATGRNQQGQFANYPSGG